MNFRIDLKNIQRIPFEKYNDKFTFIVDGKEYLTSRIVADLLSPIICRYHFEDEAQNEFIINSNDKSKMIEKYFNEFLNLAKYNENYEVNEERISAFSEIFLLVGNIDEFYKLQGKRLDTAPFSQIIEFLQLVSTSNSIIESTVLNELADKCASHFDEMSIEELKTLELSTVEMILSSSNLQLRDEDWLVDLIIKFFCRKKTKNISVFLNMFSSTTSQ